MQVEAGHEERRGTIDRDQGQGHETVDELGARRRFNALIAPHLSPLRVRARQLCRSTYDADDLLQDTLLRAFRARNQVQDATRVRGWLLKILTHAFIDAVRLRQRRPQTVSLVVAAEVPASVPDQPEPWQDIGVDDVRAAIERLTEDVRETYRMSAIEGRDHATIARLQKIATATVGTRVFRARKQLRVLLAAALRPGDAP